VTQQHRIIFFVNGFEIRLILSHLSENLNPKPQVKIVSNTMSELEPKFGFRVALGLLMQLENDCVKGFKGT
jgi:hypothetical protein